MLTSAPFDNWWHNAFGLLIFEYTEQSFMHAAIFYRVLGLAMPPALVGIARASGYRWAATKVAAIYFVLWLVALWLVPLVPAQPKLGPVYTPLTHLVPLRFPLLLIAGAGALDFLLDQMAGKNKWLQAAAAGAGFVVVMVAVQWPLGNFLISPLAENRIFGTAYYPYMQRPSAYHYSHEFFPFEKTPAQFWLGMFYAVLGGVLTTRLGLAWGEWMRRVKR